MIKLTETDFDRVYEELSKPVFNYGDFIAKKDDRVNAYRDMLFNKSGIYMYVNLDNGHKYVGQAINLYKRLLEHNQVASRDPEDTLEPIDAAIKHYTPVKFNIEILKFVNNKDLLDKWEKEFISAYGTYENINDYNLTPGGNEINYLRQSIFWDEATQKFNKRSLNIARAFIQTASLSFVDIANDLAKPVGDTTKQSSIWLPIKPKTVMKINNCEGIYKLNYYEKAKKGFSAPLNTDSHAVGRNQHPVKEFYIFDIAEDNLIPENAIAGPLKDWRAVSRYIFDGEEIKGDQIGQVANGKSRDGKKVTNSYIWDDRYKIKSFIKEN